MERIRASWTHVVNLWNMEDLSADSEIMAFAEKAYRHCEEWFGTPEDAHWRYELFRGPRSSATRNPLTQSYLLLIREPWYDPEETYGSIAHEMYHRFTTRWKTLRRILWVDEMVAFLTTQHILIEEGSGVYAHQKLRACLKYPRRMDIQALERTRRRRPLWPFGRLPYPRDFGPSVAVLGHSLEEIVGWEQICRLVRCRTWNEWYRGLPPEILRQVRRLLEQ